MNKLYAERDIEAQGNFYTRHVSAMTSEDLHRKSDIAAELAHRDIQIEFLWREVKELRAANRDLQHWFDDARATAEGAQAPGSGKTCRCIGPGNGCCCERCDDAQSQPAEPEADGWNRCDERLPKLGQPVNGYHPDWVDPDFNPKGVRECFRYGDGMEWHNAMWVDGADCYTENHQPPLMWSEIPEPPKAKERLP